MSSEFIIKVENLSKTFVYHKKAEGLSGSIKSLFKREKLEKHAVKGVSFNIRPGEFVGFIGPNGAGKTTTLKMLSGILFPSHGSVIVAGHTPSDREDVFKKKISIVMGQKSQLWITLPAIETYNLIQKMYDVPEKKYRKRLKELAQLMGVEDILNVQVRKLSLGQRMKCELIASLLHEPDVLFLDEPTIGLDVLSQKRIREFLKKYNKEKGTTVILTSHNMDDVENLCERIIIINEGEVGYDGSLEHVISEYSNVKYIRLQFSEKVFKKDLKKYGEILHYEPYQAEIRVPDDDTPKRIKSLFSKFKVKDINVKDVELEEIIGDIFMKD